MHSTDRAIDEPIVEAAAALFAGERDAVANMANLAALIGTQVSDLNWSGFYLLRAGADELVLGPFSGRPACVRIALGRGVCGTAAARRATIVVPDVHAFPGHIACDPASRSEIVVPLVLGDTLLGVLDVDSPRLDRFSRADQRLYEELAAVLVASSDWTRF